MSHQLRALGRERFVIMSGYSPIDPLEESAAPMPTRRHRFTTIPPMLAAHMTGQLLAERLIKSLHRIMDDFCLH